MVVTTVKDWFGVGFTIMGKPTPNINDTNVKTFVSFYGCSPEIVTDLGLRLESKKPKGDHNKHLLWALFWLKSYTSFAVVSATFRVAEKTANKWIWLMVRAISTLVDDVVSLQHHQLRFY